jgi:hypothetical protein
MKLKAFLAAIAVALMPGLASAITVGPNEMGSFSATVSGDFSTDFDFDTTGAPLKISFSVSGSGMADDLGKVRWQVDGMPVGGVGYSTITGTSPASAVGFLGSFTLDSMTPITVTAFDFSPLTSTTGITLSYTTSAIPLPAAGWMFVSALAGMGFLARKKARA